MPPARQPKLLVVDDEDSFRRIACQALEGSFEIIEAANGLEALQKALNFSPECILLDIMLPEIGGLVLCETLKQIRKTQTIPIVMLSGRGTEENRRIALESGAADFLAKPVDLDTLHATVMNAFSRRPSERRQNHRLTLSIPVRIDIESEQGPFSIHTMTEDISASGMRFYAEIRTQIGDPIQVYLLSGRPGVPPVFGARGQIAWVNARFAPLMRCGAQLPEVSQNWIVLS
jgi:CheY-like chemotaxis protein